MARRATNRETLADLIAGGLGHQAAYLTDLHSNDPDLINYLRTRHPRASLQTLAAAARWVRFSSEAAQNRLNRGERPRAAEIPIDPTIPRNRGYRYELEVAFIDPNPLRHGTRDDRTQRTYLVYHTNELQTADELRRGAARAVFQRMTQVEGRRRDRSPVPEGVAQFDVEITVRTVFRRGN